LAVAWLVHTGAVDVVGTKAKGGSRRGRKAEATSAAALTGPTVLVVGTDDWAIEQASQRLVEAGSPVLTCHEPGEPAFPCNALIEGRTCPLDAGFDVVATVRARASSAPVQAEFGVVCGVRAGVPLVVAGLAPERPYGQWAAATVGQDEDLASACREVAARRAAIRVTKAQRLDEE
jgi:hypothetical protein